MEKEVKWWQMMHKSVAKDILREYELLRSAAEISASNFKRKTYEKSPKLMETDNQLKIQGLNLARYTAQGNIEKIKSCEKKIKILRENRKTLLAEIKVSEIKFLPKYACGLCKDSGYVQKNLTQIPEMCKCFKQKLINAHYSLSNLDQTLDEENFDNFDFRLFSDMIDEEEGLSPKCNMEHIFTITTQFASNFGKEFNNLLLFGESGLGKTFMCHAIAKELLDKGFTVLYLTAPRLMRVLSKTRNYYEDQTETNELLSAIDDVDLLILDDLGTEVMTVVTNALLFDIINYRLITKKPMVISTNLCQNSLMEHYTERIVSRFIANYIFLKFFGKNIRETLKIRGAMA